MKLNKRDILLWAVSTAVVLISNIAGGSIDFVNLSATLIGATSLIFLAKGSVTGQVLMVIFSILYAVASWRYRYWGEMITYLGMTLPMAVFSGISWIKHPAKKGVDEVKIHRLTHRETVWMFITTGIATLGFGLLLIALDTPNIVFSIISITTSFLAGYLTFMRSPAYALAYASNDVVLIVLWVLATITDKANAPLIANFVIFLVNDLYGYYSWKQREHKQRDFSS